MSQRLEPAGPRPPRPWREAARAAARLALAPALIYLAAFVLLTWPAVLQARDGLIGDNDAHTNVWTLWWLERAWAEGRSFFHTDLVHHPFGTSLRGTTLGLFNAAVGLPLRAALDLTLPQTYNLLLVGSFVAAGVTAFLLAHRLTGSWPGALAAGFVYTFSHWHVARGEGHLNLVASQFLPLFALTWLRLLDRPGLVNALLAALAFGLCGLCDLYFFLACAFAGGLLLAGRALDEGRAWLLARERVIGLTTFAGLALLAGGPLAAPVAQLEARDPLMIGPGIVSDPRTFSADLLGLVVPGHSWRFGERTQALWSRYPNADSGDLALGLPVLALAVWVWRRRAEVAAGVRLRAWCLVFVAMVVLALGPELQVAGRGTGVPLPWAALEWLPPLRLAGKPSRLMVVATLAGAVIVAAGVQRLWASPARRPALLVFVAALLLDHWPRAYPDGRVAVPAWVETVRAADRGAVLHDPRLGYYAPLHLQTLHGKPMAFGYLARYPSSVLERERPLFAAHLRADWRALRETFRLRWLVVPAGVQPPNAADLTLVVEDAGGRLFELTPR